jgi:hypothetical protein
MSWLALDDMPGSSTPEGWLERISAAGYEGVQFEQHVVTPQQLDRCRQLGLDVAASARINLPEEAGLLTEKMAGEGFFCATLHVGWGIEDNDTAHRLLESILDASERYGLPLYVETHRATIFQDLWRTVQFIQRYPDIQINGDFSHWYTGQELVYGDIEEKWRFLAPVFERVRFFHGRIGNPGSMQVDVGDGTETNQPFVSHFREMWTRSMCGFLRHTKDRKELSFVPELLSPRIYYGRVFPDAVGILHEESDRWAQSLVLCRIARECFDRARSRTS